MTQTQDQWLVRTGDNKISGPYSGDDLRKQVSSGKYSLQDEICQANGHWLFLHEQAEVLKQLGVTLPRNILGDEVTETQTENLEAAPSEDNKSFSPIPLEPVSVWKGFGFVLMLLVLGTLYIAMKILRT